MDYWRLVWEGGERIEGMRMGEWEKREMKERMDRRRGKGGGS